jgi:hypothetical protein
MMQKSGSQMMHNEFLEEVARATLGREHVASVVSHVSRNSDGNCILWVNVNYKDLSTGPSVDQMQAIVDRLWSEAALSAYTPVVNFNSAEEQRPLEAAE